MVPFTLWYVTHMITFLFCMKFNNPLILAIILSNYYGSLLLFVRILPALLYKILCLTPCEQQRHVSDLCFVLRMLFILTVKVVSVFYMISILCTFV